MRYASNNKTAPASTLTKHEHTAIEMAKALIGTAPAPCLSGLDGFEPHVARAAVRMADILLAELNKESAR